jgi:hypothetical protein
MKPTAKTTAGKGLKFIPLKADNTELPVDLPGKITTREWKAKLSVVFKKTPTVIVPHLQLSAAKTKVSDKGYINAIGCRSIFPEGPNIDFVPNDSYGGTLELWMLQLQKGDSFAISFRVICGHQGTWKISSSETAAIETAIVPAFQTIDFFIPPIDNDYGMALIKLEPQFAGYGSWVFKDVTVQKVSF